MPRPDKDGVRRSDAVTCAGADDHPRAEALFRGKAGISSFWNHTVHCLVEEVLLPWLPAIAPLASPLQDEELSAHERDDACEGRLEGAGE